MSRFLQASIDRAAVEYQKLSVDEIGQQLKVRAEYTWQLLVVAALLLLSAPGGIGGLIEKTPPGSQEQQAMLSALKSVVMFAPMVAGAIFAFAVYRAVQGAALHRVYSDARLAAAMPAESFDIEDLRVRTLLGFLSVDGLMIVISGYLGFLIADDFSVMIAGLFAASAVEYLQGVEKSPVFTTPTFDEGGLMNLNGGGARLSMYGADVLPVLDLVDRAAEGGRDLVLTTPVGGRGEGLFAAIQGVAARHHVAVQRRVGDKPRLALSGAADHRLLVARSYDQLCELSARATGGGAEPIGDHTVVKTLGGTFHYQKIRSAKVSPGVAQ